MDRSVDTLAEIVQQAVEDYARVRTWKGLSYPVIDLERRHFAVLMVPNAERAFKPIIVIAARLLNGQVLIDVDSTDRPLAGALTHAGIPSEKIIRVYAGEAAPV